MSDTSNTSSPVKDPIAALAARRGGVMAVITGVEGPSYRPVGAVMAVFPESGGRVGTLSSGCIESDIALHAGEALATGQPRRIRYGRGSPYVDIRLPCGGGLDILLVPRPDRAVLSDLVAAQAARRPATLRIATDTGALGLAEAGETARTPQGFQVQILPETFFYVFGKGPEASTFAGLVQGAGFANLLLSPDRETLAFAADQGCPTRHLTGPVFPADIAPDAWSAIVLFFHDHEWEPPILSAALDSPAFYIGAQGSRRARDLRHMEMESLGIGPKALARLRGPIGLVPSARDARTLAVSVLAEVLAAR